MTTPWRRHLVLFLAHGFGAGRVPAAPGTAGSLVGLGIGALLAPLGPGAFITVTASICIAGFPICHYAAQHASTPDPPGVVWDEIAGMLVALIALPDGWYWWVIAFALFRLFDVLKPWPIGWVDRRIGGGAGIMLDDLLAGTLACAAVQALARLWG